MGSDLNLSVTGWAGYTAEDPGLTFTYYVWAAACTEVELDVLTGQVCSCVIYGVVKFLEQSAAWRNVDGTLLTLLCDLDYYSFK